MKPHFGLYTFHKGLPALFTGYLSDKKREASKQIDMLVAQHLLRGGVIHVCPSAIAYGASFSRNQNPRRA